MLPLCNVKEHRCWAQPVTNSGACNGRQHKPPALPCLFKSAVHLGQPSDAVDLRFELAPELRMPSSFHGNREGDPKGCVPKPNRRNNASKSCMHPHQMQGPNTLLNEGRPIQVDRAGQSPVIINSNPLTDKGICLTASQYVPGLKASPT